MSDSDLSAEDQRELARLTPILLLAFLVAAGLYVSIIVAYAMHFKQSTPSNDPADWGVFGDYVGGIINPAVSLAAFTALLYTIRLQTRALLISRRELKESTETLKLTKDELAASKVAQQKQGEALGKQNIDNTFFNLLRLLRETLANCAHDTNNGRHVSGPENVREFLAHCLFKTRNSKHPHGMTREATSSGVLFRVHDQGLYRACAVDTYFEELSKASSGKFSGLPGYMRNLVSCIKFVLTEISGTDQPRYFRMLQAQLGGAELVLLTIHGLRNDACYMRDVLIQHDWVKAARIEYGSEETSAIFSGYPD